MKKTLLVAVMSVIMICMAACGGNKHSKAFNESKKIMDKITSAVNKAKDCDDLDMAAFMTLGILGVEGIDAMSEEETAELSKMSDKMNELLEKKRAEFNCKDDDFWGSSDDDLDDSFFDDEDE